MKRKSICSSEYLERTFKQLLQEVFYSSIVQWQSDIWKAKTVAIWLVWKSAWAHFLMSLVPWDVDWEVLLVNRSVRTRKVSQSISLLGSDDVCRGRVDCTSDACLHQLRADWKAICVQPPIYHPTGNFNSRARKRPVDCHIGSILPFADFPQFCSFYQTGREKNMNNTKLGIY